MPLVYGAGSVNTSVSEQTYLSTRHSLIPSKVLLFQLILSIIILASDVLLGTNCLAWPLNRIIRRFPVFNIHEDIIPPPYIVQSAFCIAAITLLLFYASGLYAEKIGYANRYVRFMAEDPGTIDWADF